MKEELDQCVIDIWQSLLMEAISINTKPPQYIFCPRSSPQHGQSHPAEPEEFHLYCFPQHIKTSILEEEFVPLAREWICWAIKGWLSHTLKTEEGGRFGNFLCKNYSQCLNHWSLECGIATGNLVFHKHTRDTSHPHPLVEINLISLNKEFRIHLLWEICLSNVESQLRSCLKHN